MDEKTIILFDDYLQGNLDATAKEALEARIQNEPTLADAFHIFKEASGYLDNKYSEDRRAFKNTLGSVSKEYFSESTPVKKEPKVIAFRPWKYAVAACAILLIGGIIFNSFSTPGYDDYAFDGDISLVERSGDEEAFAKAESAFNAENYEEAISYFEVILENQPTNSQAQYYMGIACVETDQFEKAASLFDSLRKGTSLYKDDATWYLALSKLKQGKNVESIELLNSIPSTAQMYTKAQKLAKKLD